MRWNAHALAFEKTKNGSKTSQATLGSKSLGVLLTILIQGEAKESSHWFGCDQV